LQTEMQQLLPDMEHTEQVYRQTRQQFQALTPGN
jgi:hypothetical protein